MSKGVIAGLEIVAAIAIEFISAGTATPLALALVSSALSTEMSAQAEIKARNAYNASLRDRYVMNRSTLAPRQLVFGRARVSGPIFFMTSYGSDNTHLVMCVALAAHEVDAIETLYFDDQPVTIDSDGNVTATRAQDSFSIAAPTATVTITKTAYPGSVTAVARYGDVLVPLTVTGVTGPAVSVSGGRSGQTGQLDVYYQPDPDPLYPTNLQDYTETFTAVTGSDTFALSLTPNSGTVFASYPRANSDSDDAAPVTVAGVSGNNVTISGATPGSQIFVYYQVSTGITSARVRRYTGGPGQVADAPLISELPGTWTAAHAATGITYLVVELTYNDTAFLTGVPNVSAVVRGMKCYDPRSGTTAWTENPALHTRALATHPLAGNLPSTSIDDAAISQTANICDTTTTYTVGGIDHVRPLYRAGYAFSVDTKPMNGLTDLCLAMGGGWVFSDGQLRVRAGAYTAANPITLDETWLSDSQAVQVQVGVPRASLINTVTSSIADEYQDWRIVPLPRLAPPAYVAADNATLSQDVQMAAVTFSGQAQYIQSCRLRQMRQGLTLVVRCNYRAWPVQTYDVQPVSLARFGWVNKPFEVVSDTWTADGEIELTLRETAAAIWDMDAGFDARDIAPNTNMPVPWGLLTVTSLAGTTGDSTLLRQVDGTVLPRIAITWGAITDPRITEGGYVEIRYWAMGDSSNNYQTVTALGTDTGAYLTGVRAGTSYLIMARTGSVVTTSPWCQQIAIRAQGKSLPPVDVAGFTAAQITGGVVLEWDPCTNPDYLDTELHLEATWNDATAALFRGAAVSYTWPWPADGTYTVVAKHRNTSGILSTAAASHSITVNSGKLVATAQLNPGAATDLTPDTYDFGGAGVGSGLVTQRTFTVTPIVDCVVQFQALLLAAGCNDDSGIGFHWSVSAGGGADVVLGSSNSTTSTRQSFPAMTSFAATGGIPLVFKIITINAPSSSSFKLYTSVMNVTEIRR